MTRKNSENESKPAAVAPPRGYWAETWRRFRKKRLSMLALGYVASLIFVAILAPVIVGTKPLVCKYKDKIYFPAMGYVRDQWENPIFKRPPIRRDYGKGLKEADPESWVIWPIVFQDPYARLQEEAYPGFEGNPVGTEGKPSRINLMGTSHDGTDVFAQMVYGTRVAVLIGFVSVGISALIGITVGVLSGYFGGWVDTLLSRIVEVVMCIPSIILILALVALLDEATIWHMMMIIGVTSWTGIARLTRAEFLRLKQLDFVTAARALGAGHFRITFMHILRNALAPILVPISFGIASAILVESSLSYLGLGKVEASWGKILNDGKSTIEDTWWLIFFPGWAVFLTVLAYNLIGEGLQDATDPRLREAGK